MFVYSYFFRASKYFRIVRTVPQVLLSYINTFAEMTSLLHKFCRDHSGQKSNTSIKKRSPHQQHQIGSPYQHVLRRCHARSSIIFTSFTYQRAHSYLQQCTILIAVCPGPMSPPAKKGVGGWKKVLFIHKREVLDGPRRYSLCKQEFGATSTYNPNLSHQLLIPG